jgi:hypothetical protein
MSFSNYLELELLDHLMGKGSYTPPTVYIALSTADPGEAGAGMAEPSGNGYQRKQTAAGDWNVASSGQTTNANELAFPEATGSWGTITHFAFFDASTSGNFLGSGALTTPRVVDSGTILRFAAADCVVSLD